MTVAAIVVAAGSGLRFGGSLPKQYELLDGRPALSRTIRALMDHPAIHSVLPVIGYDHQELFDAACGELDCLPPITGREDRQGSVMAGLEALQKLAPSHVLIHDGARPLVDADLIDRVIAGLALADAVLPAVPVVDSLKRAPAGVLEVGLDRAHVVRAQTPQGFAFQAILDAHRAAVGRSLTDDTAVAQAAGMTVRTVMGSENNLKITTRTDLGRAEAVLAGRTGITVSGLGFDVHAFGDARPLILCGIEVPHELGLAGHSDADVGLHAITDAILGTIADGDIGSHFPPSEPQWKDASSDRFLEHALERLAVHGGQLQHVDLVIICERPKIGPHRDAMRKRIAELTGLETKRVSVKATTSERLGFTGRGEGIAAQAVVTVRLPS